MAQIKLGMTDCPIVRDLLDSGQLDLDYLEVHGPYVEKARQVYPDKPMILHNSLYQWSLTHPDGLQFKDAARFTRERTALARTPWYSLHLGFSCAELDFVDEAMVALSPLQPRELVLERCIHSLNQITALLNMPVLIENLDYNPTQAYEYVCEPDFITQVLEETNTYLLLDLAHAQVSAAAFGMDVKSYLNQLPLEKVRQLHLNRPGPRNGRLVDAHLDLAEADYQLLSETLKRTTPWSITLEYNRDGLKAIEQIKRLRALI